MTDDALASRQLRPGDPHYRAYIGPPAQYDFMGATQFRLLTALGLREEHYVLDIGCGSLRAGRLLIPYLLPDRYHGLDPNGWLIDAAIRHEVGADLIRLRRPRFDYNAEFDYAVFGRHFDFVVAQSIFSHTGKDLTERALANLPGVMVRPSIALVTFVPATSPAPASAAVPAGWVYPGLVSYADADIADMIARAGLFGIRLPWFHPRQIWYALAKHRATLPTQGEMAALSGAVLRDERFASLRAPS